MAPNYSPDAFQTANPSEKVRLAFERYLQVLPKFSFDTRIPQPLHGPDLRSCRTIFDDLTLPTKEYPYPLLESHQLYVNLGLAGFPSPIIEEAERLRSITNSQLSALHRVALARIPLIVELNFGWLKSRSKGLIGFDVADPAYKTSYPRGTHQVRIHLFTHSMLWGEGSISDKQDVLFLAEPSADGRTARSLGFIKRGSILPFGSSLISDKEYSLVSGAQGILAYHSSGHSFTFTQNQKVNHALAIGYGIDLHVFENPIY